MQFEIVDTIRQKIDELYVMARYRFLEQFGKEYEAKYGSAYTTQYKTLNPPIIRQHLRGKRTIGVHLGESNWLTKFICFDVDIKENPAQAGEVTQRLVKLLIYEYGIDVKDIHVSDSGGKGYHVEMFFNAVTPYKTFESFYLEVLDKLDETKDRIELRPTNKGVKIPLGIHRITNKRCYYVDTLTLEPIKSMEHILSIQQMDFEAFKNNVLLKVEHVEKKKKSIFSLTESEAKQTNEVMKDMDFRDKQVKDVQRDIIQVLNEKRLLYSGTRHDMTLKIAKFFYWQGEDSEVVKEIIYEILMNTWENHRAYISEDTTIRIILDDIERTVNDVYAKGYKLVGGLNEVELSKSEIIQIISLKSKESRRNLHLKELIFSFLIHSKRHSNKKGIFYMSYSTMMKMGNTENRPRLKKYIDELVSIGLLEVVSRRTIDEAKTEEYGFTYYKPNQYKLTFKEPQNEDEEATIEINTDVGADSLFKFVIPRLLTEREAKKILPKTQYYNTGLKEAYSKII